MPSSSVRGVDAAGAVGMEVPVVGLRHQVAGIRKRRHPRAPSTHGVPADVVGVQVGVDDDVDGCRGRRRRAAATPRKSVFRWSSGGIVGRSRSLPTPVSTNTVSPSTSIDPGLHRDPPAGRRSRTSAPTRRRAHATLPAVSAGTASPAVVDLRLEHAGQRRRFRAGSGLPFTARCGSCRAVTARCAWRCRNRTPRARRRRWCRTCAASPSRGPSRSTGTSPSRAPATAGR